MSVGRVRVSHPTQTGCMHYEHDGKTVVDNKGLSRKLTCQFPAHVHRNARQHELDHDGQVRLIGSGLVLIGIGQQSWVSEQIGHRGRKQNLVPRRSRIPFARRIGRKLMAKRVQLRPDKRDGVQLADATLG